MAKYNGFFDSLYWNPEEYINIAQDLTMIGKKYGECIGFATKAIKDLGESGVWTGYLYNELISELNENIDKLNNDADILTTTIPSKIARQAGIQSSPNRGVISHVNLASFDKILKAYETSDDGKGAVYIDVQWVKQGIQTFTNYMEEASCAVIEYNDVFNGTISNGMNVSKDIKLMQILIEDVVANVKIFNKQFSELLSKCVDESVNIMENASEESKGYTNFDLSNGSKSNNSSKKRTGDEFFDKYLNDADWLNGKSNNDKFLYIAGILKNKVYESAKMNNTEYNSSVGLQIPGDIYKDSKIGKQVDCSSFVCMALYEYSILTQNKKMTDFINGYRVEVNGSNIGPGGQIASYQFYDLGKNALKDKSNYQVNSSEYKEIEKANNKLNDIGLAPIYYTEDVETQRGDILVSKTHMEIYTGKDDLVYSCGSDDLDSVRNVRDNSTSPTKDVNDKTPIILRMTETENDKTKVSDK